jgi:hypothetical protein
VDEKLVGEGLALQPLFDRLSRLLGQLAGVALLACAGADSDRQAGHLAVVKEQLEAAHAAFARLVRPQRLADSLHAMAESLALMDEMTACLDRRPAGLFLDDGAFSELLAKLNQARRLLLSGSAPGLGIGLVDFAGACCAFGR